LFNATAGGVCRSHCVLQCHHGRWTVCHNCSSHRQLTHGSVMAIYRFALELGDILSLNVEVFLVVTSCRLVNSYRCFEEHWCLHLQGQANLNWHLWNVGNYIYHSTWRKMAEYLDLHSHRCAKLKFCKTLILTRTVAQVGVCTFVH